ncbi:hypothetical protein ABT247_33550, partial [Kitasatospora sp. NPDC001539]
MWKSGAGVPMALGAGTLRPAAGAGGLGRWSRAVSAAAVHGTPAAVGGPVGVRLARCRGAGSAYSPPRPGRGAGEREGG